MLLVEVVVCIDDCHCLPWWVMVAIGCVGQWWPHGGTCLVYGDNFVSKIGFCKAFDFSLSSTNYFGGTQQV